VLVFLLIAVFKASLVLSNFMELCVTRAPWRLMFGLLLGTYYLLSVTLYFYAPGLMPGARDQVRDCLFGAHASPGFILL
jgi:hypothetical protein